MLGEKHALYHALQRRALVHVLDVVFVSQHDVLRMTNTAVELQQALLGRIAARVIGQHAQCALRLLTLAEVAYLTQVFLNVGSKVCGLITVSWKKKTPEM